MRALLFTTALLLLAGCAEAPVEPSGPGSCDGVDRTEAFDPLNPGGTQIQSPVLRIPPNGEIVAMPAAAIPDEVVVRMAAVLGAAP